MHLPKFVFMSSDFLRNQFILCVDKDFYMLKDAPSGHFCFPSISL